MRDQVEDAKRLCHCVKSGTTSQLGNFPGKDGAARRKTRTKEKVLREHGLVFSKDKKNKSITTQKNEDTAESNFL